MSKVRIWDLPTRLFHWLLVLAISGALVTQYLGGTAMAWHFRFGYLALSLVGFRVIWGLIGTRHARFASFVRGPGVILAYLRGRVAPDEATPGHNPLGALSVLAMLGVVLLQTGSGLFASDDIAAQGPLAKFVDQGLSEQISTLHAQVGAKVIYALVGLHLCAIAYYRLRRRVNLIWPMVSGDKMPARASDAVKEGWGVWVRALICFLACAATVGYLTSL